MTKFKVYRVNPITKQSKLFVALLTAAFAAISSTVACAETIALKREQGIFVVPVVVNGELTLNFMIDSGASDVSIPADVVSTLMRTGTIDASDFMGSQRYQLADGSFQLERRIRIRSLRVGSMEISNVVASEGPAAGTPLLGQSFLARLPSWSIDNQRHVLVMNESTHNAGATKASVAEAANAAHATPLEHRKAAAPTEPDPAEQLAQQQCDYFAAHWGVDKQGPLEKTKWIQGCMPGRIDKIHEYENVPADVLAQQHQADCANMWAYQLQRIEVARQEALYSQRTFGGNLQPCEEFISTCVADKRKIFRLYIGDQDYHRGDPCTEADLLSRGGAPE